DLLRLLDSELRLVTPTDPAGDQGDNAPPPSQAGQNYYQLTHDYLVPSLREWLTRKQRETRRGRAELLLADRAAVWKARPENRQLPPLLQWFQINRLTQKNNWTPPQRKMMRKATRYYTVRGLLVAVILALLAWGSNWAYCTLKAQALRDRLLDANITEVPTIVGDMAPYRRWVVPLVWNAYQDAEANQDSRKKLYASLALLPMDPSQVTYLHSRLFDADPEEVVVIRDAMYPHKEELIDSLWTTVKQPPRGQEGRRP